MKKLLSLFALVALCGCSCGAAKIGVANFDNIIPQPKSLTYVADTEGFMLTKKADVVYAEGVALLDAEFLTDYVALSTGIELGRPKVGTEGDIVLSIDSTIANPEGYRLAVSREGVEIVGASADGLFYGIQALRKALPVGKFRKVEMPAVRVEDWPQFGYRGLHLDVSRHFDGVEFVKKYIDIMALHNMNTFVSFLSSLNCD